MFSILEEENRVVIFFDPNIKASQVPPLSFDNIQTIQLLNGIPHCWLISHSIPPYTSYSAHKSTKKTSFAIFGAVLV